MKCKQCEGSGKLVLHNRSILECKNCGGTGLLLELPTIKKPQLLSINPSVKPYILIKRSGF